MKTYTGKLTKKTMPQGGIYVFGSNTQGRHGKGAAFTAKHEFDAEYGVAQGPQGQCYAICTKDISVKPYKPIYWRAIVLQIKELYAYAKTKPENDFYVVYKGVGINLNGYTPEQMAKMFALASIGTIIPSNIVFEEYFCQLVAKEVRKQLEKSLKE